MVFVSENTKTLPSPGFMPTALTAQYSGISKMKGVYSIPIYSWILWMGRIWIRLGRSLIGIRKSVLLGS